MAGRGAAVGCHLRVPPTREEVGEAGSPAVTLPAACHPCPLPAIPARPCLAERDADTAVALPLHPWHVPVPQREPCRERGLARSQRRVQGAAWDWGSRGEQG